MRLPSLLAPALAATLASAHGQTGDLTSLSLEDFMKVEVTSVSKSRQKLVRSPAAVFVITQEDIRRSGASNLPEVLRLAPGVHVARISGNTWAVGIRGFNNIYSNKLLVLVDGRTVYNPLLSGTLWDENLISLEDVEHIEVVRGPGATMWGANAVSGIISITTRSARRTTGGLLSLSGGSLNPARAGFRYGREEGDAFAWRTSGQYSRLNSPPPVPGAEGLGALTAGRAGVRMEWDPGARDSIQIDAEVVRTRGTVTGVDLSRPGTVLNARSGSETGSLMGRWAHQAVSGNELSVRLFGTHVDLDAGSFTASLATFDGDVQETLRVRESHTIVAGAGARANLVGTVGTPAFSFQPSGRNYFIYNGFIQDEWRVVPDRLMLVAGGKVERYTGAGSSFQPTGRVMWTPTQRQVYWAAVSRAVRIPAHTDYAMRLPVEVPQLPVLVLLEGSGNFKPELLTAFEAGSRFQVNRRLALDVTGFHHRYGRLHGYSHPDPASLLRSIFATPPGQRPMIPVTTANVMNGVNQGVEVSAQYEVRSGLQIGASYSSLLARTSFRPGFSAATTYVIPDNTPGHQGQVRASWDFARGWSADSNVYVQGATGSLLTGYTRLDFHLSRKLGESTEIGISGQNLLRPYQREFGGDLLYIPVVVPRSIEITIRRTF